MKNTRTVSPILADRLAALEAEIASLKASSLAPAPAVAVPRIARGTADVTRAAVVARLEGALETAPRTLAEKIEAALRDRPRTMMELALDTGATPKRVSNALRDLRGKAANVGSDTHPVWTWIIGDETTAAELSAQVLALVSLRPFTLQELVSATGARRNRISGALVRLVEAGRVENHGSATVARWYAPPAKR
jgi:predicted Rossmann fold nucleotide-binding protein DprA/Smf involved in DNA uptake